MAAAIPLKASILDKLIGEMGVQRSAATRDRVHFYVPPLDRFGEAELRASIQRDIGWILNDINFEAAIDLEDYPEVKTSVLNQGLPELTGRSLDQPSMLRRASEVTAAIRAFEQRLRPESITVSFDKSLVETQNKLRFSIGGEIRNAVEESWIELNTTVDLDDGHVEVAG